MYLRLFLDICLVNLKSTVFGFTLNDWKINLTLGYPGY